jgi:cathepsin B
MKILTTALVLALAVVTLSQDLPTEFDARTKWPDCVGAVLDQGSCGSCWSFSATTSMAARHCIHAKNNGVTELSPQYLLDCNRVGQSGCQGGDTFAAYKYIQQSGISTLACTPYTSGTTGTIQTCPKTCKDGDAVELYQGVSHYSLVKAGDIKATVRAMQEDLFKNGPLSVSFVVYSDFMTFFNQNPKAIYQHKSGGALGGHAVKLVGWGTENGVDYWLIANSWGEKWGDKGYFRIVRGKNDCTVEQRRVTAGLPKVQGQNITYPLETSTVIDGAKTRIAIDEEIIEIARFALSEIASSRGIDTFHGVKEAYAQVQNGIVYDLVLGVSNVNGADQDVQVRVVRNIQNKLTVAF